MSQRKRSRRFEFEQPPIDDMTFPEVLKNRKTAKRAAEMSHRNFKMQAKYLRRYHHPICGIHKRAKELIEITERAIKLWDEAEVWVTAWQGAQNISDVDSMTDCEKKAMEIARQVQAEAAKAGKINVEMREGEACD